MGKKREDSMKELKRPGVTFSFIPLSLVTMAAPTCLDHASYPPLVRHLVEGCKTCIIAERREGKQAGDRRDDYI